jgi:hypothetical protein
MHELNRSKRKYGAEPRSNNDSVSIDYDKYKQQIKQIVRLALNVLNDQKWSREKEKGNIPVVEWLEGISIILEQITLRESELSSLCGSFIGFEYIGQKKKKERAPGTNTLFRADCKRLDLLKLLKKDGNKKELSINDIAIELKLDYNFVRWLLYEYRYFNQGSEDKKKEKYFEKYFEKYPDESPLNTKKVKEWNLETMMTNCLLQLCIPELDEDNRFQSFSAKPICLFHTEVNKEIDDPKKKDNKIILEFKTYRGIVGERNITK